MTSEVGPLPPGRARDDLVAEVEDRLAYLPRAATVVVACSGGPDSVSLAHLTADARPDLDLILVYVAHGLRPEADEERDRQVVATHGAWLGAEVQVRAVRVDAGGHGLEAAAREARYAALRSAARDRGAHGILLGHQADDQAETVLLRLARGTGPDGLAAMSGVAGDLGRPLLRIRRVDLLAFVAGEGLPTADDETNRDRSIRRVVVRCDVLPALGRVAADPVGALVRLADLVRDDADVLTALAAGAEQDVRHLGDMVALRRSVLRESHVAIARRLVRTGFLRLGQRPPSASTVAAVLTARSGASATLPGAVELRVERDWTTLSTDRSWRDRGGQRDLVVPGVTPWEPADLTVQAFVPRDDAHDADGGSPGQIALRMPGLWTPPVHRIRVGEAAPGTIPDRYAVTLPALPGPVRIRAGVPGDRIRGHRGRRRIVELLREAGMPRCLRPRWPVLVADDQPVWIPGVAVDTDLLAAGRRAPGLTVHATPVPVSSPRH